eukprot:9503166-Pyramimonas_sp.AAC.2
MGPPHPGITWQSVRQEDNLALVVLVVQGRVESALRLVGDEGGQLVLDDSDRLDLLLALPGLPARLVDVVPQSLTGRVPILASAELDALHRLKHCPQLVGRNGMDLQPLTRVARARHLLVGDVLSLQLLLQLGDQGVG